MTAHSGDSSAQGPVFPPFGPAVARPASTPAAPGTPAAPPAGGAIPPFMPFASPAAPVAATPTPAPAAPQSPAAGEPLPWEAPVPSDTAAEESAAVAPGGDAEDGSQDDGSQDGGERDLPWLELPTGAPISRHEEPLPADVADRAAIDASSTAEEAPWEMPSGPTAADEDTSTASAPGAAPWETTAEEGASSTPPAGPEAAPWETPDAGSRGTASSDARWEALADAGSAADAPAAEPWASDETETVEAAPSSSAETADDAQRAVPDWMSWGGEEPQDPATIEPVEGLVGIGDLSPSDLPPSAETAAEAPEDTVTPEPVSSDVTGVVPVGDMNVPSVPPRFTMDDGHEAEEPAPSEAAEPFTPSATGTGAAGQGLAAAMDDVADRLEGIVRALRSGDASAFLASGSADPLHLLVTGFVLGYAERDRAGNGRGAGTGEAGR